MNLSFDFEKPIAELVEQLEKVKQVADKSKVDVTATIKELEEKIELTKNNLYSNLWVGKKCKSLVMQSAHTLYNI